MSPHPKRNSPKRAPKGPQCATDAAGAAWMEKHMPRGPVVITGASTGIGRACALDLAGRGFEVFAGVRSDAAADAVRAECVAGLHPLRIDVTDSESIAAARDAVAQAVADRGLAGLINNAGIALSGPMEYFPMEDVRRIFDVNYFGAVETTQAFLPHLKRGRGRLVLMSSIGGRASTPFAAAYSSTKFAIEAFGDALRSELKPWGIEVISIEPGVVETPLLDKMECFWGSMDVADAPPAVQADYGAAMRGIAKAAERFRQHAIAVEAVSTAVRHAMTDRRPKTRQTVGRNAWIQENLIRRLPDRCGDAVDRHFLGLPG